MLAKPEYPLRNSEKTDQQSKKRGKVGGAFKSAAGVEYENYRSASLDSSSISKKDLEKLRQPLIGKVKAKKRGSGDAE